VSVAKQLDALEGRLATLEVLRAGDRTRNLWRQHGNDLDALSAEIGRPLLFLAWLRGEGVTPGTPDNSGEVAASLDELSVRVARDPEAVGGSELIGETKERLRALARSLVEQAEAAWVAHAETLPPVDADVFAQFEDQTQYAQVVAAARREDDEYRAFLGKKFLATEEDRRAFEGLMKRRAATRQKLPRVDDEEIRAFVTAAARGGAPLEALTEKIQGWLREYSLEDSYVVRRSGAVDRSDRHR
jgi:hypothetical protein